jgi:DNA repair photolyase
LSLLDQVEAMAKNTAVKLPVMLSDCTDPYQPLERECRITRGCIEVLIKHDFPLLVVTKSDLVVRDIDVFKQGATVVSVSITTPREEIARLIEPEAPAPEKRLSALEKIAENGVPVIARIDPILPGVNDGLKDFEELVSALASVGVRQVTASTVKFVRRAFSTLKKEHPQVWTRLQKEFADGSWFAGYKYMRVEKRREIVKRLRSVVLKHGLDFASCREGFADLNTALCDGTGFCRRLLTPMP